jgi:hypothetical protein
MRDGVQRNLVRLQLADDRRAEAGADASGLTMIYLAGRLLL